MTAPVRGGLSGPIGGSVSGGSASAGRARRGRDVAESTANVLITMADLEPAIRVNAALLAEGIGTVLVPPVDDVRSAIRREHPDVVVFTGGLLDVPQMALVRALLWEGVPAVALVDVADPQMQARLRDAGYAALYPKPVIPEEVAAEVHRLLDRRQLALQTGLYGESAAIRQVLVQVEQMAPVSSTVLVEGESGTGKELVARAIHLRSPRRAKPFIAVNVGALPETLLESELFGHEKGAFTGAAERRLGRFELADHGTLFLDEIGEIPPATQVKLLRVLEEREVTRLGGVASIPVDVRVVAATNRPLREHVTEGAFRSDLYYRLNVLRIELPPLRERRDDIPLLVRRFVAEFSARHDRPFHGISADAMRLLVEYDWPGNVRELRNLIESMVVLAPGREVRPEDLPEHLRGGGGTLAAGARLLPVPVGAFVREGQRAEGRELEFIVRGLLELKLQVEELRRRLDDERAARLDLVARTEAQAGVQALPSGPGAIGPLSEAPPPNVVTIAPGTTMAAVERAVIEAALRETAGNRRRAAELLGIGERTLYRKLNEYQAGDPDRASLIDATGGDAED